MGYNVSFQKVRASSTPVRNNSLFGRRYLNVVAVIFLAFAALAACTDNNSDDAATDDTGSTSGESPAATDVTEKATTEPEETDNATATPEGGDAESEDELTDDHDHDHDATDEADDDHAHNEDELANDSEAVEVDEQAFRLIVSDGEQGEISVLDVETGETEATFEIQDPDGAPNRFAVTKNGRYTFVGMYGQDDVALIDGGVWVIDHDDHGHYYAAPPELVQNYPGGQPAHIVSNGEYTAIFYDADGTYRLLDGEAIAEGGEGVLIEVDAPHHGVAVPWDDERIVVTVFGDLDPEETTLPEMVSVSNRDGEIIEDGFPECPGLHGEVVLGERVAFACSDSVLVLEEHGDHFHADRIEYPDDEGRAGTLRTASGLDVIVGNYSDDAFVVIDPAETTMRLIEIPEPFSTFAVSSNRGGTLLGMSASGNLHAIDVGTGEVTTIESVTEAYDEEAAWTDPTPQIAVGPNGLIYVSEPEAGQVHEIDLASGEINQSHDLPGTPFHLAVLGIH
jgi:hypothetical protein